MRAAIELAEAGTVLVVAKDSLRESSSEYAQGGIAVALSDDDEVELHEQDTLYAGSRKCAAEALPRHALIVRSNLSRLASAPKGRASASPTGCERSCTLCR